MKGEIDKKETKMAEKREVKGQPAWKPINLFSSSGGTAGDYPIPDEVARELQRELEAYNEPDSEEKRKERELLTLASVIPIDELRKMAAKYVVKEKLMQEKVNSGKKKTASVETDELGEELTQEDESSGIANKKITSEKVDEVIKEGEKQINNQEGGENMNLIDGLKHEMNDLKVAIKELISVLAPRVSEPPKETEKVDMPNDKAPQKAPITSEETVKAAETKEDNSGDIAKRTVEKPKQETVEMPSGEKQTSPVTSEEKIKEVYGQTKIPDIKVEQDSKSAPPTATEKVEMPSMDLQTQVVREETTSPSNLPGAEKVTPPAGGTQTKPITAKFTPKRPIEDSYWTVYEGDKKLFSVSLRQAFSDPDKYWKLFISPEYGKTLVAEVKTKGVIPTLEQHFGGGRYATLHFGQGPVSTTDRPVKIESPESGFLDEKGEEKMEKPPERDDVTEDLTEIFAIYLAGFPEEKVDEIINQLKNILSSNEEFARFSGAAKTKAEEIRKEMEKGETENEEEEEEIPETALAVMKKFSQKNPFFAEWLKLYDKISEKSDYIKKLREMVNKQASKIAQLEERVMEYNKKEKARKAAIIAEAMVLRGLIPESEKENKIKELSEKSNETLDTLANEVAKIAIKESRKIQAMEVLPLAGSEETSYLEVMSSKEKGKEIFSTPPVVDIKEKKVIKKSNW